MVNRVFGMLTIISDCENTRPRKVVAKCECGNIKEYHWENIKRGHSLGCGCVRNQETAKRNSINIKHGFYNHPLWHILQGMKERCYNINCEHYKDYGGRGITVCDEWLNDFLSFENWCLENGWERGLEIDRRENDGIYEPGNCRFVTSAQNCRNRRSNIFFTFNNRTMVLKDWAIELGIKYKLLHKHIKYKGFSFEDAIQKQLNK